MTIQDVEQQTGITKKNIRFYEKEGLVQPGRGSNQYRSYTPQDVERLLHIKLLRRLGMSLEEIRLIFSGQTTFANGLRWHIGQMDEEIRRMRNTRALCKRLLEEQRDLDALHTGELLLEMDEQEAKGEGFYRAAKELAQRVRRVLPPMPVYQIEPKEPIVRPADVDRALIDFAVEKELDLTFLRGNSFIPVVMLDGQKLWGFCRSTRFGYRILYLYHTQEESQYYFISNTNIKRVLNLFKLPKRKGEG